MMKTIENVGALIGRILMAFIFVTSGLNKFTHPGMTMGFMAKAGLPMVGLLMYLAATTEVGGGILLAAGFYSRVVAFILFLFLIPTTLLFHVIPGGQANAVNALKNLAIMGGLLIVATQGGGGLSIDGRRAKG
jgi:putative oxidoreductase